MKNIFKTITIATAYALPIASHADIRHISTSMTLQELNQFLEDLRTEGLKNLEPLRTKIEKTRGVFTAATSEIFEDFSGEWYNERPEDEEWLKKYEKSVALQKRQRKGNFTVTFG